MKWSAWSDGNEGTVFVPGDDRPRELQGNLQARRLIVIEATSWNDAMTQYYAWQGWGPYKPMLDEHGKEYPEDNLR